MKKRILSILLLCCMVLTLLPTAAFAAGKIWVGTEEELLAALADNTIDKITLTADITVSQTLVIDRQVVLVLDHRLKIDREQSGSGTLFHITKSGYLDTDAGSITDNVLNEGRFYPLQISGEVINEGEIIRGSFSGKVKNRGSINNGSFRGEVENDRSGKITDGEFYGEVTNHGEISGREFYGKVTNEADGIISYGKFYGDVVNNGTITGGSFFGTLTGNEIQGDLYRTVTFDSDGGSAVTPQQVLQGQKVQRPADPIKDGHTFIGWYNKDDLQYVNMPEWNFDYPVFENLELVAQWMEAMPISADPVAYLDENGQTKYCTKYSVLTSETKESILDYDDKWYDLPAGWYVVEGNVTITPRVDTHGAVNLILTNGSHLTAEWGIDVKVGDTFTVYAQSTDEGTMGRLTACLPADFNLDRMVHYSVWPDSGMAGIGSSARWRAGNDGIRESEGTIVINGGNIRAKGQDNASAIGGTRASDIEFRSTDSGEVYNRRQGGGITINGGVVRTEPFALPEGNPLAVDSVGIGTCQMGYGGSVTINGGTVIAEAANDAITTGDGGTITINGGDVTARGGVNNFGENSHRVLSGNGIGPYESGSVIINGGTVKATAKGEGFGIGGARIYNTGAMTVTINDGEIEATANHNNAAIGDKGNGKSGVTINGGVIHAVGKGGAAGIGSKGDIRITGGELTVSAEGSGAAIGGFTDSYSERVDCKSITINGDVIKSISSKDGACIGGAAGGSVGSITISDAELPLLSSEKVLIGWDADSPGGKLTIRNCRVESTDIPTTHTDGIRVGSNSEIVIENSEIRLPHLRGIRVGGNGSIAVRDSDLHTYGIFMDETVQSPNDAKTLKKLEITGSTVLTGDIIGARGDYSSVEEIVIRGSSIRLNDEYTYNYCTIGGGTGGSFGSIDIQDSQIDITSSLNAPIGSGLRSSTDRESRIRIANSQVSVRNLKFGPAIGSGYTSHGGRMDIIIENSTVTAKGGDLRSSTDYIPGIGKNASGCKTVIGIQILNSTVDSFRLTESGGTDYVHDDLDTKELPGIPAENISICGSTVNGKTIAHSFDEYGKCTLCGKYDLGYCYEHGLLTMEGLTGCVSDGSEKKLTGLSHKTGENETKQLTENTDYTASYSNNVHPYTLAPDDVGFDPAKAPKVTLYGAGNYCGKAEHYFTISENAAAAPSITTSSLPDGKVGEAYSQILTATGTTPITWSIIGALPDGLSLNKDTGKISGTPTAAGSSTFTVKATNSAGSDTKELSITITKDAPPAHEHSYGDWRKDGTSHWHECTDDDCPNREESINDKAAHVYDDDADTTCDVCGYERTVTPPPHEHSYGDWRKDGTSHWHECTDDDCPDREESIKDKAAHVYTDDADTTCDTCGYERTITPPAHEHRYGDWRKDGTNHWHECTDADCPNREESIKDKAAHVYTDDADTTCDTCGYERTITPPAHKHRYGDWRKDGTNHWHECTDADCPNREESIKDKAAHVYDNDADTTCNTCGYERTVTPPAHEHIVTFDGNGGTSSVGSMTTTNQKLTSLPSASRSGSYSFDGWYTKKNGGTEITTDTEFPADTTVYAHWTYTGGGGSSGYSYYTIKATAGTGGSISPSGNVSVREGRDQTFTITPDKGYAVANVKIDGKSIGAVKSYTFENVKKSHTIEVVFMKANGNPQTSVFVDVATGSYYEEAVDWAVENGITKGTTATTFSPNATCTRAQAVTFLWRAAGSPDLKPAAMPFNDVPARSYYYNAVLWAVEQGIVNGTSATTFSPNMNCSRGQIVTMLWRSEGAKPATSSNPFADVNKDAYYADAVLWAVGEKITKGTSATTFSPDDTCTRAQIVTFLYRFTVE